MVRHITPDEDYTTTLLYYYTTYVHIIYTLLNVVSSVTYHSLLMEAMSPDLRKMKTAEREGRWRAERETVWPAFSSEWEKMEWAGGPFPEPRACCEGGSEGGREGERGRQGETYKHNHSTYKSQTCMSHFFIHTQCTQTQ